MEGQLEQGILPVQQPMFSLVLISFDQFFICAKELLPKRGRVKSPGEKGQPTNFVIDL